MNKNDTLGTQNWKQSPPLLNPKRQLFANIYMWIMWKRFLSAAASLYPHEPHIPASAWPSLNPIYSHILFRCLGESKNVEEYFGETLELKWRRKIGFEGLRELVMAPDKHEICALSSTFLLPTLPYLPSLKTSNNIWEQLQKLPNYFARSHKKNLEMDQRNSVSVSKIYFLSK